MRLNQIREKALEMDVSVKAAIEMRKRYLVKQLEMWCDYLNDETNNNLPYSTMEGIIKELQGLIPIKPSKDSITDEMIEKAREYPIDSLISFERGNAHAWCHEDKSPSLSHWKKGNRARCFPCDKTFNSIDVLVSRDGMNFIDAVRWLCSK